MQLTLFHASKLGRHSTKLLLIVTVAVNRTAASDRVLWHG